MSDSQSTHKPRGVWGKDGQFLAKVSVAGHSVFLGKFSTVEAALASIQTAQALRDQRKAAGLPLTTAELRGLVAQGPDLFAPATPQERAARQLASRQRRFIKTWRSFSNEEQVSLLRTLARIEQPSQRSVAA